MDIDYITYFLKDLIMPLFAIIVTIFAIIVAWKKGLIVEKRKKKKDDDKPTVIRGDINVNNISPSEIQKLAYDPDKFDEYHQQSISQSRISFWFSLFFATVGFAIITTSIFTYSEKTGLIGIISGTIIDGVSALFFVQSNKARQLMSDFFDKLRQDRKLEESLKLCESIEDQFLRNALKVKLSLFFSGLEDNNNTASEIIRISRGAVTDKKGSNKKQNNTEQENSEEVKRRAAD